MNSARSNSLSLKYRRFTLSGCKNWISLYFFYFLLTSWL